MPALCHTRMPAAALYTLASARCLLVLLMLGLACVLLQCRLCCTSRALQQLLLRLLLLVVQCWCRRDVGAAFVRAHAALGRCSGAGIQQRRRQLLARQHRLV